MWQCNEDKCMHISILVLLILDHLTHSNTNHNDDNMLSG